MYIVVDHFMGNFDRLATTPVLTRKKARKVAKTYRRSVGSAPGEVKIYKLMEVR